jgi:hypothetical protein
MTDFGAADLAPLFVDAPSGAAQPVSFRQGVVVQFDPVTLTNQVKVGDTLMTNLNILGVGEATLLTVGSVVGILVVGSGGATTMYINGPIVTPDTQAAFDAIALLSAQTIADAVMTQQGTVSTTYTDLATVGPTVQVNVRKTGRLLITMSCWMQWAASITNGGDMAITMSGANTLTPTSGDDSIRAWQGLTGSISHAGQWTPCGQRLYEGLNSGLTTIKAVYKSPSGGAINCDFSRRILVVQTL